MEFIQHPFEVLHARFPADDYWLILVILGMPLIGAFVNGVFGRRLGNEAVSLMALIAVGVPFVLSLVAFAMLGEAQHGAHGARFVWHGWEWLTLSGPPLPGAIGNRSVPIEVAFSVDALSGAMALVVTGVGFLIHLYSTKYMEGDPGYPRFFAYMNLFIFSMLVLVLGDNLPMLFVGWEGVGLCSYLLIGFWYQDNANAAAGKKAFITNRIGDFGLLIAMAALVYYVGALDWRGIEAGRDELMRSYQVWPVANNTPFASYLGDWFSAPRETTVATIVALALFLGCAGKSAQIPLYVWLPDAMAGPTPVSALIHAATMVTAGVYLVCRASFVFALSPTAMVVVATVGMVTAVFAATIALVQNDIKKVLAYSTVSQLGYMFLGVGVGAFTAGFFHVVTHAFFKACLFLGAGSVIHAMHARIHSTEGSQDMRNMGGLRQHLPATHITFLLSVLAIAGFPLTGGFFSKDEILFRAWNASILPARETVASVVPGQEIVVGGWLPWWSSVLFWGGVLGAVLTAFYMGRLYLGIFWGEFKGWEIVRRWKAPAGEGHDHHEHHESSGGPLQGPVPKESPLAMTVPLWILAGLATVAGIFNAHQITPLLQNVHWAPLDHWLEPVFHAAHSFDGKEIIPHPESSLALWAVVTSVAACFLGLGVAYWMYVMKDGAPARQLARAVPGLHKVLANKYYVDEIYEESAIGMVDSLGDIAVWIDRWVVDLFVARVTAAIVRFFGSALRLFQTGRVQVYATAMLVGVASLGWYLLTPHASAVMKQDPAGRYKLTAAAGLGREYRWDVDDDGKWDGNGQFGAQREIELTLKENQARRVRLQVRNGLGLTNTEEFELSREPTQQRPGQGMLIEMEDGVPKRMRTPDGKSIPLKRPAQEGGDQ